jgi:hypothetical protein
VKKPQRKKTLGKRPPLSRKPKVMTRELLLKHTEYDPKGAEEFVALLRQLRHNRPLTALKHRKKVILVDTDVVSYLPTRQGRRSTSGGQTSWYFVRNAR